MTRRGARVGVALVGLAAVLAVAAPAVRADGGAAGPASILLEALTPRVPEARDSAYDESIVSDGPPHRDQAVGRRGLGAQVHVKEACPEPTHWRLEPPPLPGRRPRR